MVSEEILENMREKIMEREAKTRRMILDAEKIWQGRTGSER